ncbi:MAG: hypothetical protein HOQ20_06280, partial [Bradyrhizobium sp.]|nr:hypothetical protein [Bradyrhizobium sp.]
MSVNSLHVVIASAAKQSGISLRKDFWTASSQGLLATTERQRSELLSKEASPPLLLLRRWSARRGGALRTWQALLQAAGALHAGLLNCGRSARLQSRKRCLWLPRRGRLSRHGSSGLRRNPSTLLRPGLRRAVRLRAFSGARRRHRTSSALLLAAARLLTLTCALAARLHGAALSLPLRRLDAGLRSLAARRARLL